MLVPKPKHRRYKPKRINRGKFSKEARWEILQRDKGCCNRCGKPAKHIHHVMPKASGKGRGVVTNGMVVCYSCHTYIHNHAEELARWQRIFEERYGPDYYKDALDLGGEGACEGLH